jgi:hypothetical protein
MPELTHYRTTWGSLISPYIQRTVIKRIMAGDDFSTIITEELEGLLDPHSDQYDEAHEIYSHCEALTKNTINGNY